MGYYLADKGRMLLEQRVGYRPTAVNRLARVARRRPLAYYLGAIAAVWAVATAAAAAAGWILGIVRAMGSGTYLLTLGMAGAAASQFAVSMVNWLCTLIVRPRFIPRLDFSKGIPPEHRTLVAIPAMLSSDLTVRRLVEQLEIAYLANEDENLLMALVTDFPDADQPTRPDDRELLDLAKAEIARFNTVYRQGRAGSFYLLHRPRRFNPQEGVWMGWERKRGKLADLNTLLRTGAAAAFSSIVGDLSRLASVQYVITLDTDTGLPPGAGQELVGCMAHPLNQPKIDPDTRVVVEGYAVLQPRVAVTIADAARSLFSRLCAGDPGIDPYTREVSDIYQDIFGQGSFIGKGIYDVRAFDGAVTGRFPENRVLSHDLIESCFARSGLVNDIELLEGFPSRLLADASRRHRWIRGDWQIAAWLWPRIPAAEGKLPNPLSALSRWKIFDNLRRSTMPAFLLAFLVLGWCIGAGLCDLLDALGALRSCSCP